MKDTLILHHTADSSSGNQYQKVWNYHNSGAGGKWPSGNGIQYQFVIEKSGEVIQGRAEDETTWHSGNWLMNIRSIGICLAGDFTKEQPTELQIQSLNRLTNQLQLKYTIPDYRVLNHRDVRATQCPGIDLWALIKSRRLVERLNIAKNDLAKSSGVRYNILVRLIARLTQLIS